MAIDSNFINRLPDNIILAEKVIIDTFYQTLEVYTMSEDKSDFYEDFIEIYSFYQVYAEKNNIDVAFPKLGTNIQNNLELIISFFRNRNRIVGKKIDKFANEKIIEDKKTKFKSILYDDYIYIFETEELKLLKFTITQLKQLINDNKFLKSSYQQRLGKKIDKLITNTKLEMKSFDEFWGFVGEAGIIIGKTNNNCNDIIEKIKEIVHLIWKVQARSEKLSVEEIPKLVFSFKLEDQKN